MLNLLLDLKYMFTTFVTEGSIPQTADQLVYGTVFATNLRNYYFLQDDTNNSSVQGLSCKTHYHYAKRTVIV